MRACRVCVCVCVCVCVPACVWQAVLTCIRLFMLSWTISWYHEIFRDMKRNLLQLIMISRKKTGRTYMNLENFSWIFQMKRFFIFWTFRDIVNKQLFHDIMSSFGDMLNGINVIAIRACDSVCAVCAYACTCVCGCMPFICVCGMSWSVVCLCN